MSGPQLQVAFPTAGRSRNELGVASTRVWDVPMLQAACQQFSWPPAYGSVSDHWGVVLEAMTVALVPVAQPGCTVPCRDVAVRRSAFGKSEAWPRAKAQWCCEHENVGCGSLPPRYDCTDGVAHWKAIGAEDLCLPAS